MEDLMGDILMLFGLSVLTGLILGYVIEKVLKGIKE